MKWYQQRRHFLSVWRQVFLFLFWIQSHLCCWDLRGSSDKPLALVYSLKLVWTIRRHRHSALRLDKIYVYLLKHENVFLIDFITIIKEFSLVVNQWTCEKSFDSISKLVVIENAVLVQCLCNRQVIINNKMQIENVYDPSWRQIDRACQTFCFHWRSRLWTIKLN